MEIIFWTSDAYSSILQRFSWFILQSYLKSYQQTLHWHYLPLHLYDPNSNITMANASKTVKKSIFSVALSVSFSLEKSKKFNYFLSCRFNCIPPLNKTKAVLKGHKQKTLKDWNSHGQGKEVELQQCNVDLAKSGAVDLGVQVYICSPIIWWFS